MIMPIIITITIHCHDEMFLDLHDTTAKIESLHAPWDFEPLDTQVSGIAPGKALQCSTQLTQFLKSVHLQPGRTFFLNRCSKIWTLAGILWDA
jgi:hypothetical protein